ncbi:hypothetical protein MBLNU457_g2688t2 [Dothideomycetes sp. NU457]
MRAVIWRSSLYRLPRYQRLRIQNRNFSVSSRFAASPKSPNDPSDTDKNHNERGAGEETGAGEPTAGGAGGRVAAQGSNTRSANGTFGRRSGRAGRSRDGVPQPPPIPDWFLKYNVRLQPERKPSESVGTVRRMQIVDLKPQHPEKLMETHMILPYVEPVNVGKTDIDSASRRYVQRQKDRAKNAGSSRPLDGFFEQHSVPGPDKSQSKTESSQNPNQDEIDSLKQELEEANINLHDEFQKLEGIVDLYTPQQLAEMNTQFRSGQVPETFAKCGPHTINRFKASIEARCAPGYEKQPAQPQDADSSLAQEPAKSTKDIDVDDLEEKAKTLQEEKPRNSAFAAYQVQLKLLEAQNRKRLQMAREEQGDVQQRPETEKTNHNLPPLESELDARGLARLQAQLLVYSSFDLAQKEPSNAAPSLPRNLIFCSPDHTSHDELDGFVEDVADLTHSNIVRLDANDIAELAGTYVDGGDTSPGSVTSLGFDAFEGISASEVNRVTFEHVGGVPGQEGAEGEDGDESEPVGRGGSSLFGGLEGLKSMIQANKDILSKALGGKIIGVQVGDSTMMPATSTQNTPSQPTDKGKNEDVELDPWQELKLEVYLDHLLNAVDVKESADLSHVVENFLRQKFPETRTKLSSDDFEQATINMSQGERKRLEQLWALPKVAHDSLRLHLAHHIRDMFVSVGNVLARPREHNSRLETPFDGPASGTIIHIRDIDLITETSQGEIAVERLMKVVARRRKEGQKVLIIGTASSVNGGVLNPSNADAQATFQSIPYPSASSDLASNLQASSYKKSAAQQRYPISQGYRRLVELNLRNVQDTIRRLGVPCSEHLFSEDARKYIFLPGTQKLGEVTMTPEEIERLVLFANGLRKLYTTSVQDSQEMYNSSNEKLELIHIAISLSLLDRIEHSVSMGKNLTPENIYNSIQVQEPPAKNKKEGPKRIDLEKIKRNATKHEQKLLSGVADPANIKVGFDDVHVQPETIEALKTITSLSLSRPEAFSYGVLAKDRLTGLLLYGPPGTGKTLLAKAVAKESGATVVEVSGAQIYEKYVGEGEKNVRAVFSLARKLSPCVVFIDEADALFSSRGGSSNRTTHREIINQFLREWDGMDDQGVFMMVATNRPFDLDDAVLRRLPRRVLVDLPVAKDRESILKIHLKDETLEADVELPKLAERTPFYSGSDLKNLAVAAALNAVREENELLEQKKKDNVADFKLPARRTLSQKHFDKAIQEISASISEDMSSLNAIKKFDEQYGDRQGRKKKSGYGFGVGSGEPDENDVRVRGDKDREGPRP